MATIITDDPAGDAGMQGVQQQFREPLDTARRLIADIEWWARQKCPCKDEQPDPCPLCGARVDGKDTGGGVCKAGTRLPDHLWLRTQAILKAES